MVGQIKLATKSLLARLRRVFVSLILFNHRLQSVIKQGWQLKSHIREHVVGQAQHHTGFYCLLVMYEPQEKISRSMRNILGALNDAGVNIVLLANSPLHEAKRDLLIGSCHSILIRDNQGMDFGAYKDGFFFLKSLAAPTERVLLLNDSVYYTSHGLHHFVRQLLFGPDVVAAFKNRDPSVAPHVQSFILSLPGCVLEQHAMISFWKTYRPVNNRLVNIEFGEKALSAVLFDLYKVVVVFEPKRLGDPMLEASGIDVCRLSRGLDEPPAFARHGFYLPTSFREFENIEKRNLFVRDLTNYVEKGSPLHLAPQFFAYFLGSPVWKKDAVYRGQYSFKTYRQLAVPFFDEEEFSEFSELLQNKGSFDDLPLGWKLRVLAGLS